MVTASSVNNLALPPVFKTPGPEGPYPDEIIVEILSMDDREFKGTAWHALTMPSRSLLVLHSFALTLF